MIEIIPHLIKYPQLVNEIKVKLSKEMKEVFRLIKDNPKANYQELKVLFKSALSNQELETLDKQQDFLGIMTYEDTKKYVQRYVQKVALEESVSGIKVMLKQATKSITAGDYGAYNNIIGALYKDPIQSDTTPSNSVFNNLIIRRGKNEEIKTHHHQLDRLLGGGVERGYYMSLTADNGSLKTRYSLAMVLTMLKHNKDLSATYFEVEMSAEKVEDMVFAYFFGEKPKNGDENFATISEKIEVVEVLNRLNVVDTKDFENVNDIHQIMLRNKSDIFVVDYFSLLSAKSKDLTTETFGNAWKLKEMAKATNSFGIVINQANKDVTNRKNKRIRESDAEYSKQIGNQSAYHLGLFYPYRYYHSDQKVIEKGLSNEMFFVDVLKTRNSGGYGTCFYRTKPEKLLFLEPEGTILKNYENFIKFYEYTYSREK